MSVLKRIEQRAKELDQEISTNMSGRIYELNKARDRELFELAAKRIRELEHTDAPH